MNVFSRIAAGILLISGSFAAQAAAGDPVRIAVIDSGVAATPFLAGSIEAEFDMVEGRVAHSTRSSHGTAVATVLVKAAHREVRIVSLRTDKDGKCDKTVCQLDTKAVADAVRKAIELKVDIINMSLDHPFDTQLYILLKNAANAGITIVMAAGNEKREPLGIRYAKMLGKSFWMVGAGDERGAHADFSARPKDDCGCQFVWRRGVNVATQNRGGQPIIETGTSFAAPLMAAELADRETVLAGN